MKFIKKIANYLFNPMKISFFTALVFHIILLFFLIPLLKLENDDTGPVKDSREITLKIVSALPVQQEQQVNESKTEANKVINKAEFSQENQGRTYQEKNIQELDQHPAVEELDKSPETEVKTTAVQEKKDIRKAGKIKQAVQEEIERETIIDKSDSKDIDEKEFMNEIQQNDLVSHDKKKRQELEYKDKVVEKTGTNVNKAKFKLKDQNSTEDTPEDISKIDSFNQPSNILADRDEDNDNNNEEKSSDKENNNKENNNKEKNRIDEKNSRVEESKGNKNFNKSKALFKYHLNQKAVEKSDTNTNKEKDDLSKSGKTGRENKLKSEEGALNKKPFETEINEIIDLTKRVPSGVKAPGIIKQTALIYPEKMRKRDIEGKVILKLLLNNKGDLIKINIYQSSGYQQLDKAAVDTVKNWIFKPGIKDGSEIRCRILLPIVFKLE